MINKHHSLLIFLITILFYGCAANAVKPSTTTTTAVATAESSSKAFSRQAMLNDIASNVILPLHETFVQQTESLQTAAQQFQDAPSVERLQAVQAAWKSAAAGWKQAELFGLREVMLTHNKIDKWPTNVKLIESFIDDNKGRAAVIDEPFIDSIGSSSKGLPAIEYLIFNPEVDDAALLATLTTAEKAERRMAYLVAASENLHTQAEQLLNQWSPQGEGYLTTFVEADESGGELQGSISRLANEIIAMSEQLLHDKLGNPAGENRYDEPRPQFAEAYRSGLSTQHIINNLRGLQLTFMGGDAEALGFDDYLDFLEADSHDGPLSTRITQQIEQTIAALEALDMPLRQAVLDRPDEVNQAYEALKTLIVLLKVDMANQLGITITFSDNDGD